MNDQPPPEPNAPISMLAYLQRDNARLQSLVDDLERAIRGTNELVASSEK